ncbi:MAG: hypothetical protein JJ916_11400 [Phycisphaerales bacterium]|nr:hypothetical protein [Phycisphaerales bacterium]
MKRQLIIESIEHAIQSECDSSSIERVHRSIKQAQRIKRGLNPAPLLKGLILILGGVLVLHLILGNWFQFPWWFLYYGLGGGIFFAWLTAEFGEFIDKRSVHIQQRCHHCKYDLRQHDSVLGDAVWVGPLVCPECGYHYPAIG